MRLFLSHTTALDFWLKSGNRGYRRVRVRGLSDCAWRAKDVLAFPLGRLRLKDYPLDVMVDSSSHRNSTDWIKCHCRIRSLPQGAFCDTGGGVLIASPEFCFELCAKEMDFFSALEIGMQLCGTYAKDAASESGFYTRPAPTNVAAMKAMSHSLHASRRSNAATRALKWLQDGAASPMETAVYLLLALPFRYGGYGLPVPLLNQPVELDRAAAIMANRNKLVCDICWPEQKVVVEYDSDMYHTGADRIERDALKRNALTNKGYTVITLTRRQVMDAILFERVAADLAKLLGKRLRPHHADYLIERQLLRQYLLSKRNESHTQ